MDVGRRATFTACERLLAAQIGRMSFIEVANFVDERLNEREKREVAQAYSRYHRNSAIITPVGEYILYNSGYAIIRKGVEHLHSDVNIESKYGALDSLRRVALFLHWTSQVRLICLW